MPPTRFIFRAAVVVAIIERAAIRQFGVDAVARLLAGKAPHFRIVFPKNLSLLRGQWRVAGGNREIRSALEHRQVFRLFGDHGHRLNCRGARADHPDTQAREIDRLVRPVAGVVDLALEA